MAAKARKDPVPRATTRPRVVGEQGEPVGAFLRVLAETRAAGLAIEQFDVTEDLVLEPPNESATKAMDRYRAAYLLAQTGVLQLMQYPESPPDAPTPPHNQVAFELERLANKVTGILGSDADPDVVEALRHAIGSAANNLRNSADAEDPDGYESYLQRFADYTKMREGYPARKERELQAAYNQGEEALTAYNKALFGGDEMYQRIQEFFADRPFWQKQAFDEGIKEQFLRLPKDGKCQACGTVVDPKEPSSEPTSSTGSTTIGQTSTPTSLNTSEEPTPANGSGEPGRGPSSSTTSTGSA